MEAAPLLVSPSMAAWMASSEPKVVTAFETLIARELGFALLLCSFLALLFSGELHRLWDDADSVPSASATPASPCMLPFIVTSLAVFDANTRIRLFDHHHCNHALPPRNRCLDVYLGHISTALWSLDCGCIGAHVARRCRSLGLGIRKRRQDQQAHRCRQENFGLHVQEQGARRKAFLSSSAWGCKHAIFWVQVRGGQGVLDIHTALNAISLTNQDLYMRARFYSIYRNRTLRSQFVVGLQKPTN
jgi:hypothetical protein